MLVGIITGWTAYTLIYFGFCSVRGPGVGLLDLVIPARAAGVQIPGGSSSSGAPASTSQLPGLSPGTTYGPPNMAPPPPGNSTGERNPVPPNYTGPVPNDPGAYQA